MRARRVPGCHRERGLTRSRQTVRSLPIRIESSPKFLGQARLAKSMDNRARATKLSAEKG